jgi:hypothetical protein
VFTRPLLRPLLYRPRCCSRFGMVSAMSWGACWNVLKYSL